MITIYKKNTNMEKKSNGLDVKTTSKKPYQTWSRRISKNDVTEEVEVCEAENGFIVTHSKSGYKGVGKNREWFSESKKFVARENPLEKEEEKSFSDSLTGILEEIAESEGMIEVKE
jgi:hypothetical protein